MHEAAAGVVAFNVNAVDDDSVHLAVYCIKMPTTFCFMSEPEHFSCKQQDSRRRRYLWCEPQSNRDSSSIAPGILEGEFVFTVLWVVGLPAQQAGSTYDTDNQHAADVLAIASLERYSLSPMDHFAQKMPRK